MNEIQQVELRAIAKLFLDVLTLMEARKTVPVEFSKNKVRKALGIA